jgi:hypothetical protein
MSEAAHAFDAAHGRTLVLLPRPLDATIEAFTRLRRTMIRTRPDAFTRDEWAYLIVFLEEANLRAPFVAAFGTATESRGGYARVARPRGHVAVWLPNNVSLLGPLTLILLSLTGNRVCVKAGSRADDLATAFVQWARAHDGELATLLADVTIARFDRVDARNAAMAANAHVRIAFGSDAAARAIDAFPHPLDSTGFYFANRASEAWIDPAQAGEETLRTVARVFAIYGTAGCTSPRRLVLLDGSEDDARRVRDGLAAIWPAVVTRDVPMHHASQNVAAAQIANATGWRAVTTARNAAVLATGSPALPPPGGFLTLPIVAVDTEEALAGLPANIQTLGTALDDAQREALLPRLAAAGVKRVVPLAAMHHFGALWDGWNWWRETFAETEVRG